MKKIFLFLLLMCFATSAFAGNVILTGFRWTPVSYSDSEMVYGIETDTVVWTPASGNKIVLLGVMFWSETKTNVLIEKGTGTVYTTTVIPNFSPNSTSGIVVIGNGLPIWQGADDEALAYTTDKYNQHSILFWGYEIP